MENERPIIVLAGPTAGGKTAIAIELARRLPGGAECNCADSMQIYRGMDIGTAKPNAAERATVPHHLFDIADPAEDSFTVDRWKRLAEEIIADIRSRGAWPIVVGGTNLYIKALLEGLFEGPGPDPRIRAELESNEMKSLRRELESIDPAAASRIHANDRRRTIRALEVFRQSGRPISDHQQQWDCGNVRDDALILILDYPREVINRRINSRVKQMMEHGFLDEVRGLRDRNGLGRQAREALGYKQLLAFFEGKYTLDEAVEQIKISTRRYAKQQRTWLRRFRLLQRSQAFSVAEEAAEPPIESMVAWILAQAKQNGPCLTLT